MRRHPLDVVSLVAGLLFLGLGVIFLLDRLDALDVLDADVGAWVLPGVLLALGLLGLVSSLRSRGRDQGAQPD